MPKGFEWKPYIPLALKLMVVVWVASRLAYSIEHNTAKINEVAAEQLKRSEAVWTGKVKVENLEKRMERIEDKLDVLIARGQ